ncbi:MAG: DUF2318 domain-containing protein [Mailhella sp.]|nr:DUF2318 domain-containing protein [Mailhella sp.]
MLHFFVLVFETLLAVSILLGSLMGFVWQRSLFEVRAPVKYGALLGIAAAVVLAGLKMGTGFIVREYYDLAVLSIMLPFEFLLLFELFRSRFLSSEQASSTFMRCIFFAVAATWAAYALPDIFIYPSVFAVGVVQVASSEFVFIVVGYAAGLLLCYLSCSTAYKISSAVPLRALFPLCVGLLVCYVTQQMIYLGQILIGRGLLPRYDWALDLIIFLLNNAIYVYLLILALSAFLACVLWKSCKRSVIFGSNPAERRKQRSLVNKRVRSSYFYMLLLALGAITITAGHWLDNRKAELSPPVAMEVEDGLVKIPLSMVSDGHLHRFVYTTKSGVKVRYIVIRKNESAYGVGLDACDVCGASGGYYERKTQVVCILCDVVMNKATIGFAGGCNPVPLAFSLKDPFLIIDTEDLEAEESRFAY